MDKNEIRAKIVHFLYERHKNDPDGLGEITFQDVAASLAMTVKEIEFDMDWLWRTKFIAHGADRTCYIKQKGLEWADGPGTFNEGYKQASIELNLAEGAVLQAASIGGDVSHLTQHQGLTGEIILKVFREAVENSELTQEKKKNILARMASTLKDNGPMALLQLGVGSAINYWMS